MRILEKNKAIELRKQGKTFSEVLREVPVSKSSLSNWLRDVKLTKRQLIRIHGKNLEIRRKFVEYNAFKRKQAIARRESITAKARREVDDISRNELKLIGAALYWAEGCKRDNWRAVSFTNSDAEMIHVMMK